MANNNGRSKSKVRKEVRKVQGDIAQGTGNTGAVSYGANRNSLPAMIGDTVAQMRYNTKRSRDLRARTGG